MLREKLAFKEIKAHQCYLGLPTYVGRSKKVVFNEVCDRVLKKLKGWKEKLLSKAGKEVLLKAVIQAIPMYTMQCFEFPRTLCDDLERLCGGFWWAQNVENKRLAWMAWDKLSEPKREGGLGFRKSHHFNLAMLPKQC